MKLRKLKDLFVSGIVSIQNQVHLAVWPGTLSETMRDVTKKDTTFPQSVPHESHKPFTVVFSH